jgi:hypothetical protein
MKVPGGEDVFAEGEVGTEMYVIQAGTVEIYKKNRKGERRSSRRSRRATSLARCPSSKTFPGRRRRARRPSASSSGSTRRRSTRCSATTRRSPSACSGSSRAACARRRSFSSSRRASPRRSTSRRPTSSPRKPTRHDIFRLVADAGGEFFLNREGETTVGRIDPVTGIRPDVDLANLDTSAPSRAATRRSSTPGKRVPRRRGDRDDERDVRERDAHRHGRSRCRSRTATGSASASWTSRSASRS